MRHENRARPWISAKGWGVFKTKTWTWARLDHQCYASSKQQGLKIAAFRESALKEN